MAPEALYFQVAAISTGVVRGILERFAQQVSAGVAGAEVTVRQLVESGRLSAAELPEVAPQIGRKVAAEEALGRARAELALYLQNRIQFFFGPYANRHDNLPAARSWP